MIGAQVTPDLFRQIPRLMLSLAALTFSYWWPMPSTTRSFGALDGTTAPRPFTPPPPAGSFESIAMGDEAGADLARLTLQQFLRVIVVVTALPLGLSLWLGEPVGSAGGMTLARDAVPWQALPGIALAGLRASPWAALRLPAKQLTGPMAVAAIAFAQRALPARYSAMAGQCGTGGGGHRPWHALYRA